MESKKKKVGPMEMMSPLRRRRVEDKVTQLGSKSLTSSHPTSQVMHSRKQSTVASPAHNIVKQPDRPGFGVRAMVKRHRKPISDTGKRQQQVKLILLILLPFATLLSVAVYMNTDSIFAMIEADQTKTTMEFSVFVGRLIVVLQKEQDQSVLYLSSIGPETKFFLAQTYMETDLYLDELPYWPTGLDRSERKFFDSKNAFQSYLQQHRNELSTNFSIYDEILFYKESIDVFLIWLYDALKESRYSSLWKTLVAYQKVINCVHYAGIERALGTTYFVEGGFSDPYLYIKYNEVVYVFKNNFESAMKYSQLVKPISTYISTKVNGENLTSIIERYRDQIQFQNISAPSVNAAAVWFDLMSTYLDVLFNFQTELADDILKMLHERSARVLTDVASSTMVICLVIIILPLTLRALYRLTNDIQSSAMRLAIRTKQLNWEKKRTELLLHQMLPKAVADRLKRKNGSLADYFREVTIFFSDIPGFTDMASQLEPLQIVRLLNQIYTVFDSRIEEYDVYKMETIGDSYMVVSGLPKPNEHRHAIEVASMALDLMAVANELQFNDIEVPVERITLRVGIHTGPVVAGVVGMKLPRYCLFGDTVNTASRMETHGMPHRIHVSSTTRKLLVRYGKGFILECRGKVSLKGKGNITGYWLHGQCLNDQRTRDPPVGAPSQGANEMFSGMLNPYSSTSTSPYLSSGGETLSPKPPPLEELTSGAESCYSLKRRQTALEEAHLQANLVPVQREIEESREQQEPGSPNQDPQQRSDSWPKAVQAAPDTTGGPNMGATPTLIPQVKLTVPESTKGSPDLNEGDLEGQTEVNEEDMTELQQVTRRKSLVPPATPTYEQLMHEIAEQEDYV